MRCSDYLGNPPPHASTSTGHTEHPLSATEDLLLEVLPGSRSTATTSGGRAVAASLHRVGIDEEWLDIWVEISRNQLDALGVAVDDPEGPAAGLRLALLVALWDCLTELSDALEEGAASVSCREAVDWLAGGVIELSTRSGSFAGAPELARHVTGELRRRAAREVGM